MTVPLDLRAMGALTGAVLIVCGALTGAATVLGRLAWALPLTSLPGHPGTVLTLALVSGGIALRHAARALPPGRPAAPVSMARPRRAAWSTGRP